LKAYKIKIFLARCSAVGGWGAQCQKEMRSLPLYMEHHLLLEMFQPQVCEEIHANAKRCLLVIDIDAVKSGQRFPS
jgi:hypothetical protein